jgi:hypothetical protein
MRKEKMAVKGESCSREAGVNVEIKDGDGDRPSQAISQPITKKILRSHVVIKKRTNWPVIGELLLSNGLIQ